jgi:hypothetical protein
MKQNWKPMRRQKGKIVVKPDAEKNTRVAASKNISGEHWRFCLQCGHELINEKCKLRCPCCHYFMSCSDFDFAG